MSNIKLNGKYLTSNEEIVFWIVIGISALLLLLSIGLFSMWIYYSWIKRNNSKNYTGEDITKFLFEKTGTNVEIKKSIFYAKYWNYNKRKGTHKLRPWTFSRRSVWTMMEASQQAYVTTIRKEKGKQFWWIFRLPFIFRLVGAIAGMALIYLGASKETDFNKWDFQNWLWIISGISVIFIGYTIADAGRVYVFWKNVVPLLKDSGLSEKELKAINRIYFWRLVYSVVAVILEIIKLIIRLTEFSDNKSMG